MKRDMELVRKILLFLEDEDKEYFDGIGGYMLISIDGYSKKEVDYHLEIMKDSDIIKGDLPRADDQIITHSGVVLNWRGHDFIDTFSNDSYWNGTKKYIKSKGLEVANVPFEMLIEVGKGLY